MERKRFRCRIVCIAVLMSCFIICLQGQFAGGQGTQNDPWLISRPGDLNQIRDYLGPDNANRYFLQTNDIDLDVAPWNEGEGWEPLGTSILRFTAQYDGGGYVIDGLYINRPDVMRQGLFGDVENATIQNLGVTNADVTGQQYSGPIFGYGRQNVLLKNCWTSGTMRGFNTSTGGLVGYIFREVTIENCYSETEVTGVNYVGGLVGMAFRNHTIRNCYTKGSVTGNNQVGGLFGLVSQDDSAISNCYSLGRVSGQALVGGLIGENRGTAVTTSYWNTVTSQQNQSQGGTGKTTDQMIYPYADGMADVYVRWDFDDIWVHDVNRNINNGYPYLHFQAQQIDLDSPSLTIELITINNAEHIRLNWRPVDNALSYKIYTTNNPYSEDWGAAISTVGENVYHYTMPIGDVIKRFFRVTASINEP